MTLDVLDVYRHRWPMAAQKVELLNGAFGWTAGEEPWSAEDVATAQRAFPGWTASLAHDRFTLVLSPPSEPPPGYSR